MAGQTGGTTRDSIGVVTVSRGRPELLRRAMASVRAQDVTEDIEHVIVIDDDLETLAAVRDAPRRPGLRTTVHLTARPPEEVNEPPGDRRRVYPRLSRLFNLGARIATTEWIAFLDDDNEYEPHHLSSLLACAREHDAPAVHSGRKMYRPDGSPYLDELWHTAPNPHEGRRLYELMCERGVRVRGTNIVLDRADPVEVTTLRPSTVLRPEDPVLLVDQSVWLIRRKVLLDLPIPETFTEEDYRNNAAPDDKLLERLIKNGVRIFSTRQPTVRYYLGGISNNYRQPVSMGGAK